MLGLWQEVAVRSAGHLLACLLLPALGLAGEACSTLTGLNSYSNADCSGGCSEPDPDASLASEGPSARPDGHTPVRGHNDGGNLIAGNERHGGNGPGESGVTDAGSEGDAPCDAGAEASCGPQTCVGCLGSDGLCSTGAGDKACGLKGVRCQDCASIGETCAGGACTPPSGDSGHLEQRTCDNVAICSAECKDDCLLGCTSADTCLGTCGAGCLYTCIKATNCLPRVGDRSVVTCASSGTCDATCTGTCVVRCASVGQCHVTCPSGVTARACEGGTGWACGEGC